MSISVFAGALASAAGGIFVGFERMKLNSFTQILQAFVKTAFGPILIVLGFGVLGAIYASMVSVLVGGVVAILLVYFALFRPLRKCKVGKCDVKQTLRPMLIYGIPLTVSNIVIGVLPSIFTIFMVIYAGKVMMSSYYVAGYFAVLLSFISFPVATALFPVFSEIDPDKEPGLVKTVFASSVKYTAMLLVPATMLIVALSAPLINFLFPLGGILHSLFVANAAPKYPYAPLFLVLSCLVNLLVLVGNITLSTFQTGIKKTRQVMWQNIASLVVGLPLAYFMVQYFYQIGGASYAVIGGILGSLIATVPNVAWGLYWCWKNYRVKADLVGSGKIFAASLLATVVTYALISFLIMPYFFTLIIGFVVFAMVYLVSAPLIGAVNASDIDNFKNMLSSIWIISVIINIPLAFMRKLCRNNGNTNVTDANKVLEENN